MKLVSIGFWQGFLFWLVSICVPNQATASDSAKSVFVLVPGYFNSAILGDIDERHRSKFKDESVSNFNSSHLNNSNLNTELYLNSTPYFSQAILQTMRRHGAVVVVNSLNPIGTIEENAQILERFLVVTADQFSGKELVIIAHSAGGLYTLGALSRRPSLPIKTVVTIATPYTGIEFIEELTDSLPGLDSLAQFLNLESLREFRPTKVANVMKTFRVPEKTKLITIAGRQSPCFIFNCSESRYLSWILTLTHNLVGRPSDGIITVESALGLNAKISDKNERPLTISPWSDFNFALEHGEMVHDFRFFKALGVSDVSEIRKRQAKYFEEIVVRLKLAKLI